jgi:glycosyltransferase involved in cell wall biosynthesis
MADRRLHIAVDARELLGHRTGVGRYLSEVLDVWQADPGWPHRVTLIVPQHPPADLRARYPRTGWEIEPAPTGGTWWEQARLPRAVRRLAADVLFAPAYTGPIGLSCPTVLTIHDLSYFAHPEWFSWREGTRRRWLTRAAARRAAAILTVSHVAAAEIVERLGVPRARVHAVHSGAPAASPDDAGPREPIVLYVGSLFERRRIPDLVEAFAHVAAGHTAVRLVLVGQDRSRRGIDPIALAGRHGIATRVEWHRYLSEAELTALYARARVFAFLSEYEGFGLTPVEAMAAGVPPVVLDTPVAREVYREGATYVAADSRAIAEALGRLLEDDRLHAALSAKGRRRVGAMSWIETGRATRTVIEGAARP